MTNDWTLLVDRKRKLAVRLAALGRICEHDDSVAIDVLCTRFVDEVVRTGKVAPALDDAAAHAVQRGATVPDRPATGGSRARGPRDLVCKPYEVRDAIMSIVRGLARRSHAEPALAAWLFEAMKLWSYERRFALQNLVDARVEPTVLATGIASIVDYAAANPDPGDDILREVATAWAGDPARSLALLDRIAADDRASAALAEGLYGSDIETATPLVDDAVRGRMLVHALDAPSGARAFALSALAAYAGDDGLEDVIVAALAERRAHARVIEAAASLALARRQFGPRVHDAAERCETADRAGKPMAQTAMTEGVRALIRSCRIACAPPPSTRATERASVVDGCFEPSDAAVIGGLAVAAVRRPRVVVASSDWCTDDDELAIAIAGREVARYHAAPVGFAMRATGAAGARRHVELAGELDGRVVVLVRSPFSDDRGWGTDNYALGFAPQAASWIAYREDAGRLVVDRELTEPVDERALPRLCHGEAIVWRDAEGMRIVGDSTPYHLDDWEYSAEVRAALDAAAAAKPQQATVELAATEIAAAWPAFTGQAVAALACDSGVVTVVREDERAALVWLARGSAVTTGAARH